MRTPGPRRRQPAFRVVGLLVLVALAWFAVLRVRDSQPRTPPNVQAGQAVLTRLGSPLPDFSAAGQHVYWPCSNGSCAQVIHQFSPSRNLSLTDAVDDLRRWAAANGLHGGGSGDSLISCDGRRASTATLAPVGDCVGGWLLPDGSEVDVHLLLATPVPQPHFDAQGDFVGGGPWSDHAAAAVEAVWTQVVTSRPGED